MIEENITARNLCNFFVLDKLKLMNNNKIFYYIDFTGGLEIQWIVLVVVGSP